MHRFFSRLGLAQRLAAICGGLCLLVALALVLIGNLSSRYIIQMQQAEYGQYLAGQVAAKTASVIGNGDLIGLEVTLEQLLSAYQLLGLSVDDVEGRQIGAAGSSNSPPSLRFSAPIALDVDGNIAGEVHILLAPSTALREQEGTALGLFLLAILLSFFVAAAAASWSQKLVLRLQALVNRLHTDHNEPDLEQSRDELELLERSIANLPLELLSPTSDSGIDRANYQAAGLLYIRLNSLAHYVETLDETSLLAYTGLQQRLVSAACELYEGELSVVRQFGLLASFSGEHSWGSPAFRAASAAWMIQQLITELQPQLRLRLAVSMACGISEAGAASKTDIYPGLYCQQTIDELAALLNSAPEAILLSQMAFEDVSSNPGIIVQAGTADQSQQPPQQLPPQLPQQLQGFSEPCLKLLERQQQILVRQLLPAVRGFSAQAS